MKILVVGSGGREHALVWKIKQSPRATKIYCAPGNPGIAGLAECVPIKADDLEGLKNFAQTNQIDLTLIGPEVPLVLGLVDEFQKSGLKAFGPGKAPAQLEGSKLFAKKCMKKYKVPTAEYEVFDDAQKALEHVYMSRFPVVLKADGLAAGKGVAVCISLVEAKRHINAVLKDKVFGNNNNKLVIEEFLSGEEASMLAFCDGKNYRLMVSAQDHKAIYDGDKGPNTGGMGAYSPAPVVTPELTKKIEETIFQPMLAGLAADGMPYVGVLYAGLMITKEGPRVIEFNCRFGDPETQVILPRLKTDLLDIVEACLNGKLDQIQIEWSENPAVCIVLAADGYPGNYKKGSIITGLAEIETLDQSYAFQAGTAKQGNSIVTDGGRVLGITALGADIKAAIKNAYKAADLIHFDGLHKRKDIGAKALNRK